MKIFLTDFGLSVSRSCINRVSCLSLFSLTCPGDSWLSWDRIPDVPTLLGRQANSPIFRYKSTSTGRWFAQELPLYLDATTCMVPGKTRTHGMWSTSFEPSNDPFWGRIKRLTKSAVQKVETFDRPSNGYRLRRKRP